MSNGHGRDLRGWYALRWKILERDNFTCQYCGQYAPSVQLEVDHVTPVAEGGTDELDNLKTACSACNQGKEGLRARQRARRNGIAGFLLPSPILPDTIRMIALKVLKETGRPMTASEIATAANATKTSTRQSLRRCLERGEIIHTGRNLWQLP